MLGSGFGAEGLKPIPEALTLLHTCDCFGSSLKCSDVADRVDAKADASSQTHDLFGARASKGFRQIAVRHSSEPVSDPTQIVLPACDGNPDR